MMQLIEKTIIKNYKPKKKGLDTRDDVSLDLKKLS